MKTLLSKSLLLGFILLGTWAGYTLAAPSDDVTFPVSELGDCANKEACRQYCNQPSHMEACTTFAQTHKLITSEKAAQAKKLIRLLQQGGPGDCKSVETCKTYCEDSSHSQECLAFAQKNNLKPAAEIEKAKKITEALKEDRPGNCTDFDTCQVYCESATHTEECLAFAQKHQLLQKTVLERMQKMQDALKTDEEYRKNLRERFSSPAPTRKPAETIKSRPLPPSPLPQDDEEELPTLEQLQNRGLYTSLPQPELHSSNRRPFLARLMGFVGALILGPGY
ncbi:MAG: hypothetical protein KW806_01170 [Candidatus Yanofskybacteria bacterium]|nr:hypothetical protein [Candidatus Yanofskybacteria bacterium]